MASLLDRLQRAFAPRPRATADDRAANLRLEEQKLRVELKRTELALVQRVAADADDPLEALETVSLLTRRGKAGALPARRKRRTSMDDLREELERRRELMDVADELEEEDERRVRRRRGGSDGLLGVLERATGPLAEAVAAGLGVSFQQRLQAAPGADQPALLGQPAPPALPAADPPSAPLEAAPMHPFVVALALGQIKRATPDRGAEMFLQHAEANPLLAQFVDSLLSAQTGEVPGLLDDAIAAAEADAPLQAWLPLLRHLRQHEAWTAACHAHLLRLTAVPAETAQAAG